MEKILISRCLLGEKVRYDGRDNSFCEHPLIKKWLQEQRLIRICPEVQAGLPVPRQPTEIIGNGGGESVLNSSAKVIANSGTDVSEIYIKGANLALDLALKHQIKLAILKDGSPSCGSSRIYDGSFSGTRISGEGVTAALLRENNILVFGEDELEKVADLLAH